MNYKWLALSNTTIGTLMASLDRNIVIIALPSIANELHTSLITLVWIAIGYWVVTASMLLTFGRLADMFGRVKLYNLGFALFTIGSGLCCVSQTGEQLIVFRIIQALGAAFIFSNSSAILSDSFPESERGKALGINQISIVVGSVMGLVIGGALTSYFGWRSIFWINIPIGIFATVWAFSKLKELGTIKKEKIDWLGNLLFAGGLISILLGITFGSFHLLNIFEITLFILVGISLLVLFYKNEKKVSFPMMDLSLFKLRLFTSSNIAIFFNSLARGAFTFVMVFFLQGPTMLLNPLESGIYLIPVSLALAIVAPITGWFYDKYRSQIISQTGLIISAIGFILLATLGSRISYADAILPLALIGAGLGIFTSPNRATIMNSVPPNRRGVAAGISTTLVMAGSAFSIGLVFLIFSALLPAEVVVVLFSGSTNSTHQDSIQFNDADLDRFILSIHGIFIISAVLMVISVLIQRKMK
ncbi:Antiseptic resistance protein [Candidatus Nitrosocosmicus oleophilus]|uniref:Antiseptic resistance protein n=1 Tax=Candidatus Nitrosocosmicus oleophilus TaxID=1353260 RepID=A0A654M1D0_9ARCH|nr:MFS transporter [Candidatus Nitrosocosmicus oleophilus]ALI36299.1 Antiseptic resistance protein [Candidatus Nitrosocosmicus oleophilus]